MRPSRSHSTCWRGSSLIRTGSRSSQVRVSTTCTAPKKPAPASRRPSEENVQVDQPVGGDRASTVWSTSRVVGVQDLHLGAVSGLTAASYRPSGPEFHVLRGRRRAGPGPPLPRRRVHDDDVAARAGLVAAGPAWAPSTPSSSRAPSDDHAALHTVLGRPTASVRILGHRRAGSSIRCDLLAGARVEHGGGERRGDGDPPPSGLTATEAPKDISSRVSPTSTSSPPHRSGGPGKSPRRCAFSRRARRDLLDPRPERTRRCDQQPPRLDDLRRVGDPAPRDAWLRFPESAVRPHVPDDHGVAGQRDQPAAVRDSPRPRSTSTTMAGQGLALRPQPVTGSTSHSTTARPRCRRSRPMSRRVRGRRRSRLRRAPRAAA